jgi:hypothetical protein
MCEYCLAIAPGKPAVAANDTVHDEKRRGRRRAHSLLKLLEGFLRFIHLP